MTLGPPTCSCKGSALHIPGRSCQLHGMMGPPAYAPLRPGTALRLATVANVDRKTLEQSAMKLGEEYGELLQQMLIHLGADGTSYRNATPETTREKMLEEMADVHICLYALAYKLGFDDAEIDREVNRKMDKWASSIERGGAL